MKVGIYGGSFNPIHNGHIKLAEVFLKELGLDEVWFMVSPQNPFKINSKLLDDTLRLQLVKKALKDKKNMILMTSIAIIAGMLPQLFNSDGSKQSMAAVMIGGMIASLSLTFFLTPAIFFAFERIKNKSKR